MSEIGQTVLDSVAKAIGDAEMRLSGCEKCWWWDGAQVWVANASVAKELRDGDRQKAKAAISAYLTAKESPQ